MKQPHYLRLALQVIVAGIANAFILTNASKWSSDSDTAFVLLWAGTVLLSLLAIFFWVSNKERIVAICIALALTILLFFAYYKFSNDQTAGIWMALGGGFGMVVIGGLVNGTQRIFFGSNEKQEENAAEPDVKTKSAAKPETAVPQAENVPTAFCERCGHGLDIKDDFCPQCGSPVKKPKA